MADEALTCLTSLLENVPAWIADLEGILDAAKGRQQEILFANRPPVPDRDAPQTDSTSSFRSSRSTGADGKTGRIRPALKHFTSSDALRSPQKKRKTASAASGDQSGPCKFRNRATAVVYYDGETQKHFEKLVRAIGTSRNSIRKGKMSAKVDALSRLGSSSSSSSSSNSDGDGAEYGKMKIGLKYKPTRSRLPVFGRSDGAEAFDKVDGRLEKAQSFCERAAHQVLRDGDCTLEVTRAKEHFSEALKMVTEELPALQKRAAKAAERRRRSAEQHRMDDDARAALRVREPGTVSGENITDRTDDASIPGDDGDLEVDILEVDDAESSSDGEEFNINSFKFVKSTGRFAPHMRTSRLAAP